MCVCLCHVCVSVCVCVCVCAHTACVHVCVCVHVHTQAQSLDDRPEGRINIWTKPDTHTRTHCLCWPCSQLFYPLCVFFDERCPCGCAAWKYGGKLGSLFCHFYSSFDVPLRRAPGGHWEMAGDGLGVLVSNWNFRTAVVSNWYFITHTARELGELVVHNALATISRRFFMLSSLSCWSFYIYCMLHTFYICL